MNWDRCREAPIEALKQHSLECLVSANAALSRHSVGPMFGRVVHAAIRQNLCLPLLEPAGASTIRILPQKDNRGNYTSQYPAEGSGLDQSVFR